MLNWYSELLFKQKDLRFIKLIGFASCLINIRHSFNDFQFQKINNGNEALKYSIFVLWVIPTLIAQICENKSKDGFDLFKIHTD